MFRGKKPAGQPRTLRSITEGKTAAANTPADLPYDAQAGIPMSELGASQQYDDVATAALPPADAAIQRKRSWESNCEFGSKK